MMIRRTLYWAFLVSIIALPAWVMFGRMFFGAPLGTALLLFALLAPVFALGIALVVGVTVMRPDVRKSKVVTWSDAGWVGSWLFLFVLYGFFVVVGSSDGDGSALTAVAGDSLRDLSGMLSVITGLAVPIYGVFVLLKQARALADDASTRLKGYAERMQEQTGVTPPPVQMEATFDRVDGPQSGQRIIIEGDDAENER